MTLFAFDTETHLIAEGRLAPPIVCVTQTVGGDPPTISDRAEGLDGIETALICKGAFRTIVGHNVAYDLGCVVEARPDLTRPVFDGYEADRITDTMLRQELIDIAVGCHRGWTHGADGKAARVTYSLAALSERLLGVTLEKSADTWRLRYSELDGVPLDEWPDAAKTYALDDAATTRAVYLAQEAAIGTEVEPEWLKNQFFEARAGFALHLVAAWGVTPDPAKVDALERRLLATRSDLVSDLAAAGLVTIDKKGEPHRKVKVAAERVRAAYAALGEDAPETDKGGVRTDALTCSESGDPILAKFGQLSKLASVLSKNLPVLRAGICHTRFGLAASGRSTSAADEDSGLGDNMQNLPAKGGVRECFVPRPGCVFSPLDFGGLELATWAQTTIDLFGGGALATALQEGKDAHAILACDLLSIDYAEAMRRKKLGDSDDEFQMARQTSKIANFGFLGGLSAKNLIAYALGKYGVRLTLAQAVELRRIWGQRWAESRTYFDYVNDLVNSCGGTIVHMRSGHVRGGCSFTDTANSFFQELGAKVAKQALWDVQRESYCPGGSLEGARTVLFVHDEITGELPEEDAPELAEGMADLMMNAARVWCPDVPIKVEASLVRCYGKGKRIVGKDGRLAVWEG